MASTKNRVSHAKEAFYIICILIFLLIGLFSFVGPGGYLDMKKTQEEMETHRARTETLQKNIDERVKEIDALRTDKATIEGYARKKGYGKKGEIIQEIPQQDPAPAESTPPGSNAAPKTKSGK